MTNPAIPGKVIEASAMAAWDKVAGWDDAEGLQDQDPAVQQRWLDEAKALAPTIASWARKQAIEEALVIVNNMAADMDADGEYDVATALQALSEEVNDLRYRYDPEYDYD